MVPNRSTEQFHNVTGLDIKETIMTQDSIKNNTAGAIFLRVDQISISEDFRCREKECETTVESYSDIFSDYKQAKSEGCNMEYPFPPIVVWKVDDKYEVVAGFHRFLAALKAGLKEIFVIVFDGTKEDAIWLAMKDNMKHGLPLGRGDLKLCIIKARKIFPEKSSRMIAKELGCSRSYVSKVDDELATSGQLSKPEKRVGLDGKERSTKRTKNKISDTTTSENTNTTLEDESPCQSVEEMDVPASHVSKSTSTTMDGSQTVASKENNTLYENEDEPFSDDEPLQDSAQDEISKVMNYIDSVEQRLALNDQGELYLSIGRWLCIKCDTSPLNAGVPVIEKITADIESPQPRQATKKFLIYEKKTKAFISEVERFEKTLPAPFPKLFQIELCKWLDCRLKKND